MGSVFFSPWYFNCKHSRTLVEHVKLLKISSSLNPSVTSGSLMLCGAWNLFWAHRRGVCLSASAFRPSGVPGEPGGRWRWLLSCDPAPAQSGWERNVNHRCPPNIPRGRWTDSFSAKEDLRSWQLSATWELMQQVVPFPMRSYGRGLI